ncbi:MAG TPA: thiamine pyrophosphate-binding protein [Chthoniobacterales bacterium]|jgi:indolepyruvate decarboxylase|nr:thiamine pyrophosphate-binding protein [Chthoniobacterales bacterium]HEV3392994.1 thiamine pyrophosphate-binding protein [Chthoniobacterales bacterium]
MKTLYQSSQQDDSAALYEAAAIKNAIGNGLQQTQMVSDRKMTTSIYNMKTTSVIDYIVQRLADEGITDCFGVPGDYAFPVGDAVDSNPNIKWIGCSNELNASYAADGYARARGAAMLSTTYAVGELSAINGVMGAKAERSLVYHVVGMPSYQNQRLRKTMHHTFGDGEFGNFIGISAQAACSHAVINPDNCVIEMERVIAEARRNNQPAYIVVPSDYALSPVTLTEVEPATLKSNESSLKKAVAAITDRIKNAKSIVVLPAFTISRLGLQKEARQAIEALGCPFATTAMEKCIIDESHPQFAGMYSGALSTQETREIVEGAELVLDIGGVSLNDESTAGFSGRLDFGRFVSIGLNDVRIGEQVFGNVRLADTLAALAKLKSPAPRYNGKPERAPGVNGKSSDKITMDALYSRYAAFIRPGDNVVVETGSSSLGLPPMPLADDVQVHLQMLWGSIGWATGAAFGVALADPKRKTVLITGEGSHQLTANEIGNMGRFGAKPIILCLNNDGYMVERALEPNPDWSYNDLAKWRYADLPHALGCTDWFTARVETLGELDAALKAARESKSGAYIEIIGGRMDMPKGLAFAHTRLKELYGDTP